jgi:hypothetical protein
MLRWNLTAVLLAASLIALFTAAPAQSQTVMIADGNSTAHFDLGSTGLGMDAWTINGINQLQEHSLWFRVGTSPVQPINALTLLSYVPSGNRLDATYTSSAGFSIDATWTLMGASPGFGQSDISELIRITNSSPTPLDFHFWQFVDLNLLGTPFDTWVSIVGGNTARQYDGVAAASETADVPSPSRYEAGYRTNVLADLHAETLLNIATQTNGDLAWAFQWDRQIAPGGSLIINKDSNLDIVPEPGSLALLGVGLLACIWRWRKRKA